MPRGHYEQSRSPQPGRRLGLEVLEDRTVLSTASSPVISLQGLAVGTSYDPKHILVEFREGATPHAEKGTTLGDAVSASAGLYEISLADGVSVAAALKLYQADATVKKAEPNYLLAVSSVPNDPMFGQQWDMQNTGQDGGKPGADIEVTSAWNVTKGSPSVIVAVNDTGIDYTHRDLYQNIWINQKQIPPSRMRNLVDYFGDGFISMRDLNDKRNQGVGKITDLNGNGYIDGGDLLQPMIKDAWGNDTGKGGWADGTSRDGSGYVDDIIGWNFFANNNNPMDDFGHGTHVAGTIAATQDNSTGVTGIAPNVQVMPIKFLGSGGSGTIAQFIQGLNFSVSHGARISNNSWSGAVYSTVLSDAIANARSHGAIFVAAAGNYSQNNDTSPTYPASFPLDNVVSVAATDRNNQLAGFSDYGAHSVQLGAPGVDVLSTKPGNTYGTLSGTSQAAPHVTGVLALVWSIHPDWTYKQVINQVLTTVDKIPSLAGKTTTGGIVDAAAAVGSASVSSKSPLHIVDSAASGPAPYSVSQVTVRLDRAAATFPASAVTLTGPAGGSVWVSGVSAVAGSGNRIYVLSFATQTAAGAYKLHVGADVRDASGAGLAPFDTSFYVQQSPGAKPPPPPPPSSSAPRVSSVSGSGPSASTLDRVTVQFDQAVSPSSFAASAVTVFDQGWHQIKVTGVSAVSGGGDRSFVVTFAAQTKAGLYRLHLTSAIRSVSGAALAPFDGTVTLAGAPSQTPPPTAASLHIIDSAWTGPTAYSVSQVTVRLDRAAATFPASAVTLTGPAGGSVWVSGVSAVAGSGNRIYVLSFATQTAAGAYKLHVGADVRDASGAGLAPFDTSFYVQQSPGAKPPPPPPPSSSAPRVSSVSGSGPSASTLDRVTVQFDQAVSPSSFAASAVTVFDQGWHQIKVTGVSAVSGGGDRSFVVTFAAQTKAGLYRLHLTSAIRSVSGAALAPFDGTVTLAGAPSQTPPPGPTPSPTPGTYTSSAKVNVPTGGRGVGVISISQNTTIKSIKVKLYITHPHVGDLVIHLQAPDGTDVVLANRKGGPSANMTDTIFDDKASTYIALGRGPFTGSYQPDAELANLVGKGTRGVWKLWVEDAVGSSKGGTLDNWSLIVN